MYQSWLFFDKIGHVKSVGFRFYSAIWRSESRISSRYHEITSISLIYSLAFSRRKELLFWLSRGLSLFWRIRIMDLAKCSFHWEVMWSCAVQWFPLVSCLCLIRNWPLIASCRCKDFPFSLLKAAQQPLGFGSIVFCKVFDLTCQFNSMTRYEIPRYSFDIPDIPAFSCFRFLARAVQPFLPGRISRPVSGIGNSRFRIACRTAIYKGGSSAPRELYFGFPSLGFRIPQEKISRIPESGFPYMGTRQWRIQGRDLGGPPPPPPYFKTKLRPAGPKKKFFGDRPPPPLF